MIVLHEIPMAELMDNVKGGDVTKACSSITELVYRDEVNDDIKALLLDAEKDEREFWNNCLVSDFASAALDLLGIKKYEGEREEVRRFIGSRFNFE